MNRRTVDLAAHINQTVERGNPADFPIALKPVYYGAGETFEPVANRMAVVREDTGIPIALVSKRYQLVPHQRILEAVHKAIEPLDVGPTPRGIYVDRQGARMRAVFKFPMLARQALRGDEICPCLKIENTYDGTSRITAHIGAFRFVCTNLAVGGGGVFAGGFMSIHAGEIPIENVSHQLGSYLEGFEAISELYRSWNEVPWVLGALDGILGHLPKRHVDPMSQSNDAEPNRLRGL